MIYVYCPKKDESTIRKIAVDLKIKLIINDLSIGYFQGCIICHVNSANLDDKSAQLLITALEKGAHVEPLISFLDKTHGFVETSLLNRQYFLHQKAFSIISKKSSRIAKRALDLFSALTLGLFAIPIGLITAICIKWESPGPIFFKQKRTGKYNKEFYVIKFRSMRFDAEKGGAQWASKIDARVTRVGSFIRKTRIDELPQLINIFKNEMSLVGPRPEREVFITELEKDIPYYRFRHAVKPGITGLAQVKYPYGASVEDAIWKHKYDIHYIKHQTFFYDLKIALLTVKIVLFGMGR